MMNPVLLTVVALAVVGPTTAQAQAPPTPLMYAELEAKVTALEQELARKQSDYTILLTSCQAPTAPPASTFADQLDRARVTIETAGFEAAARLERERLQQQLDNDSWIVKSVDYAVTEANQIFIRYGWKVTIKNGISRPQAFDLAVQFLDRNGFVIDTARAYGETITAFAERTINGDDLISMPGALNVAKVQAVATRKTK